MAPLLDPREPKNLSDAFVLAILALHLLALYLLPASLKKPVFAVIFLFWRASYNVGIGYLLRIQSNHRRLVAWAKKWSLFVNPSTGKNPHPWLYRLLKKELETKIPEDYKFEDAPIEYNTWLVFRRVVDLILMCDFTSYCLFAIACGHRPEGEDVLGLVVRWTCGILAFLFNLWVKLDAHRVVKDYAWYWGDFFFLVDQELTFDGVFEMAPHPMYSIGYIGYYGISAMAASYEVLYISLVAHAAQFLFLIYVENPHIEKTYNPPQPRKAETQVAASKLPSEAHALLGLKNFDPFRVTDVGVILLQFSVFLMAVMAPYTPAWQSFFVIHAVLWRLLYTLGLGIVLDRQSKRKMWTRHFVKYGESKDEAWRQWKGMYYLCMTMCYATFIAACWRMYTAPQDWHYGFVLLRHLAGAGLIALQVWTAVSIYESLGEFGWFFGDFFFNQAGKLTYSGIYRYLNNPERIIGLAGVWGAVLITWCKPVLFLAILSHTLTLAFIQFVEKPHMQKLYGRRLRAEAGLSKSIKRSLPPPLRQWQGSVDKMIDETKNFVEEFLDTARPKLAAGVSTIVRDTSALFTQYPARITLTRLAPDLAGFNPKDYSLSVEGTPSTSGTSEQSSSKEGLLARLPRERRDDYKPLIFEYGAPIRVKWRAPVNHSKSDWVGLYRVADNESREVTRVSSAGRWIATRPHEYEDSPADKGIISYDQPVTVTLDDGTTHEYVEGEMVFEGDKLWWTQGVFEFRYHHDGKHTVMSISHPFEVQIGKFDDNLESDTSGINQIAVENALLPVVRNCFDRDPEIAPSTAVESFGSLVERDGKYARRVVFAVHQMFGIEFSPGVVLADGNVRNLAWRICNAKEVLVSWLSHSITGGSVVNHSV
ncbi:hypothetical protein DH86_00002441 [Scytalidium sp. 3C]|nr:hypothetical protein DH86_00002441 [Scytalidium sp. 3C]